MPGLPIPLGSNEIVVEAPPCLVRVDCNPPDPAIVVSEPILINVDLPQPEPVVVVDLDSFPIDVDIENPDVSSSGEREILVPPIIVAASVIPPTLEGGSVQPPIPTPVPTGAGGGYGIGLVPDRKEWFLESDEIKIPPILVPVVCVAPELLIIDGWAEEEEEEEIILLALHSFQMLGTPKRDDPREPPPRRWAPLVT